MCNVQQSGLASRENASCLTSPMQNSDLRIQSFLKFAYFIDRHDELRPIDFSRIERARYRESTEAELIELGRAALRSTFEALWTSGDHVVPLSGGFDSRLILAQLLEFTDAKKLSTVTFGVPGSYDFELGSAIAKRLGTRHTALPLNELPYHEDELMALAARTGRRVHLFYSPPIREVDRLCGGAVVWSGYIGDLVAGSHLHEHPSPTLDAAKRLHLQTRTFVHSIKLNRCEDEVFLPHVDTLGLDPAVMSFDEQLVYAEAVKKYTAPAILYQGIDFRTPFINSAWMDFMLSVPDRFRMGQRLMLEIADRAFPELFALPSRNNVGFPRGTRRELLTLTRWTNKGRKLLRRWIPQLGYPPVLYNDYDLAFRTNPSFRRIVLQKLERLKQRGIVDWLDIDQLVRRHDRRLKNHGDALIILASLEILLEAEEADVAA